VIAAYPFSAVVGMDDLKLALIVNAVSPVVGGVLLRGEKGTAKSTVVRALAALLPDVAVIEGCRFSCAPSAPDAECPDGPHRIGGSATTRSARLVELPVGASEDRVVGSLDLERALTEGVRAYQPGLLAAAHRGVLYVDEVNCCTTTWSTCCSTPRRWARRTSSATVSRFGMPPASSWSER